MRTHSLEILALLFLCDIAALAADSTPLPFVSPIFGHNMVLQRGKPNTFWGWSKPGDVVSVEIAGRAAKTVTGAQGRWQVQIEPPAPGGPYTIKVVGPQTVTFNDVLVGDVWLCGGQSNMQLGLPRARNAAEEIKAANHPTIRLYIVSQHVSYSKTEVPQGSWKICSPQTVVENGGFSAVAYFFAQRLLKDINVPIGLIQDCIGGSPAEAWTSPETLHRFAEFDPQLAEMQRLNAKGGTAYGNFLMHWYDDYDIGLKGKGWAAADFDDSTWRNVQVPGGFRELVANAVADEFHEGADPRRSFQAVVGDHP